MEHIIPIIVEHFWEILFVLVMLIAYPKVAGLYAGALILYSGYPPKWLTWLCVVVTIVSEVPNLRCIKNLNIKLGNSKEDGGGG